MDAIDHLDLVVSDLDRALNFYGGLLGPLGYVHTGEIGGERGERVVYLSRHGGGGSVSLRVAQSAERSATYDRYSIGLHHLCFSASSRTRVDAAATWMESEGIDLGGEIETAPREYGYTPGYYALFVHDPDGIKLEVLHRPTERDLAARVLALERRLEQSD